MEEPTIWLELADDISVILSLLAFITYIVKQKTHVSGLLEERTQDIIEDWKRLRGIEDRDKKS